MGSSTYVYTYILLQIFFPQIANTIFITITIYKTRQDKTRQDKSYC